MRRRVGRWEEEKKEEGQRRRRIEKEEEEKEFRDMINMHYDTHTESNRSLYHL